MTHNELKKGMEVRMTGVIGESRLGTMADNKKGVIRMVSVSSMFGHFPETGSVYVDEITHVKVDGEWVRLDLSPAHEKKMRRIRGSLKALGF